MILIDAGNTRAKFAIAGEHGPERIAAFAYGDPAFEADVARWLEGSLRERALLASVARAETTARVVTATERTGAQVERVTTPRECGGLVCGYQEASRWGVDRFAAALGLWRDGFAPFVVASAGTAIAIDVVDEDGQHLGGLIAPSPRTMRDAVLGATAGVQLTRAGQIRLLGTNTEDGLESGVWFAAAALIDRAVADSRLSQLCLTGGDALTLSPLLKSPHDLVPDAALRGLWHLAGTRAGPTG